MSYILTGYLTNCVETWHLSAHPARLILLLTEHRLSALLLTTATHSAGNLLHSQQSTCALLRRGTRRSQRRSAKASLSPFCSASSGLCCGPKDSPFSIIGNWHGHTDSGR